MNRAYAAGIVDGEGCIGFSKTRNVYYPRIMVVNTNSELLNDLRCCFGGSIHRLSRANDKWKAASQWQIGNRACVEFLDLIFDYLRIKYCQALLVFAWDEIRPGRGQSWSIEGLEAMKLILEQSKWLNEKGIHAQTTIDPMTKEIASMIGWK